MSGCQVVRVSDCSGVRLLGVSVQRFSEDVQTLLGHGFVGSGFSRFRVQQVQGSAGSVGSGFSRFRVQQVQGSAGSGFSRFRLFDFGVLGFQLRRLYPCGIGRGEGAARKVDPRDREAIRGIQKLSPRLRV